MRGKGAGVNASATALARAAAFIFVGVIYWLAREVRSIGAKLQNATTVEEAKLAVHAYVGAPARSI
jgi:hypothetical protein